MAGRTQTRPCPGFHPIAAPRWGIDCIGSLDEKVLSVAKSRRSAKGKRGKKRRGAGKRSPEQRQSAARATRQLNKSPSASHAVDKTIEDAGEILVARWLKTRSGARAGRGFHFQDAVGALLAARIAGGSIRATSIVPEGLEDMSLEGERSLHIQVKSRVEHLGPFPIGLACRHIFDAWNQHADRGEDGQGLALVLERGVRSEDSLQTLDQSLEESLSSDSPLRRALQEAASTSGISPDDLDKLLSSTALMGLSWETVTAETIAHLSTLADLPPSALAYIARELRIIVAEAADANANADYDDRSSLDRTGLVAAIERLTEHMDVDALESAIKDGICEPMEVGQSITGDDRFYEGVATQPAHVAAGLVVPRPEVMAEVLSGLQDQGAVVLTGPSGVGKSAVLWTVPLALPGVLWFRVRRLSDGDAPALIRLARAYRATQDTPVGFLVDAAGTGDFRGWARLRAEAALVPGVLLVGTARREDLMVLGDLSGCTTITVQLDETAAEVIFNGLTRRGATTAPHWREAFEKSDSLTMEFTHMLTSGRRLDDVIAEQIRVRVDQGRRRELELLSLVSVADCWSATIPASGAAEACKATEFQLREAVSRLAKEHLLVERDGVISGLHRLRSRAISQAIHLQSPPDLPSTVTTVLGLLPAPQLHRFIANLLRDEPWLATTVIEAACDEPLDLNRMIGFLHGLRLSDFYELASSWKETADRHSVPASTQPLLFQFAAADLTFPDFFPQELRAARDAMVVATGTSSRRDVLVGHVGLAELGRLLASTDDTRDAARLLSTLEGCGPTLADEVSAVLTEESPLVKALRESSIDDLADCLAAARSCDQAVSDVLVDSIGGEAEILQRLRKECPWLTELEIRVEDDVVIGYGRLLHISDELQGDPRERAVTLGRLLLRCFPGIDSVNVQALLPGGHELRIGDYTHGTSALRRQYDHPTLGIAWNQARLRAALTLLGETDTIRLSEALPLLEEAAHLTQEISTGFVTGNGMQVDLRELDKRVTELHERGRSLRPPLGSVELGDTGLAEEAKVPMTDNLSALITDLTGNVYPRLSKPEGYRALTAYLLETAIGRHLDGAYREPWHLLGIDGHPPSLDRLAEVLSDLHAVVDGLAADGADTAKIVRSARAGTRAQALHRAAETCRRAARRRLQSQYEGISKACRTTGLRTQALPPHRDQRQGSASEIAITVELRSLLEWYDAVSILEEALGHDTQPRETFVFIPLRNGHPVPSLTMKLITSVWPAPGLGDRTAELADGHPSQLADSFDKAQTALQIISGICHLPAEQQGHPDVQTAAETAASLFQVARDELLSVPRDPLTEELVAALDGLATRVRTELDGAASGPSVAEQIVVGALQGGGTEEFNLLLGARVLALEWDIDRQGAVKQLDHSGF